MQIKHKEVVILGGGICGISVAYFLKKNNIDCIVLEKEKTIGGACQSQYYENIPFEFLLSELKLNHESIRNVFTELGLNEKIIFYKEELFEKLLLNEQNKTTKLPQNISQMMFSEVLNWHTKFKLVSNTKFELNENTLVQTFFENTISSEFVSNFIQPLMFANQLGKAHETVLQQAFPVFYEQYNKDHNLRHCLPLLMYENAHEIYLHGGIQTLLYNIFHEIINEVQTDCEVRIVSYDNEKYVVQCNDVNFTCNYLINTLPRAASINVLQFDKDLTDALERLNFYKKIIAHFWVKKSKTIFPKAFGMFNNGKDDHKFESLFFYNHIFENKKNNVKCIMNYEKNEAILKDETNAKYYIHKQLYQLFGIEKIKNISVEKWEEANPVLDKNFVDFQKFLQQLKAIKYGNFYSISNYTNALSISNAMAQAEKICQNIITNRKLIL